MYFLFSLHALKLSDAELFFLLHVFGFSLACETETFSYIVWNVFIGKMEADSRSLLFTLIVNHFTTTVLFCSVVFFFQ